MPAFRARLMASARSATSNFPNTEDTWLRTVFSDRNSSRAMRRLSCPRATRSSTSRSLSVSCGKASRPGNAARLPKYEPSRAATVGLKTAPPAATVRRVLASLAMTQP